MKSAIFFLLTALFSHCDIYAQWEKVLCPQSPEGLAAHKGYIYVGGELGVQRSNDNCNTWSEFNEGLKSNILPPEVAYFFTYGEYLYANVLYLGGGLCRYLNGDSKWTVPKTRLTTYSLAYIYDVLLSTDGNMRRSLDSGNTWVQSDSGIMPKFGIAAECYGLTNIKDTLFTTNRNGQIYRSSNKGLYWESVLNDNEEFLKKKYLLYSHGSSLFATGIGALSRSTDGGYHWDTVARFGIGPLLSYNQYLFAGTYGVKYTSDNGDTWRSLNDGTIDSLIVDDLVVHEGYLYAAGLYSASAKPGGLYRIPLSQLATHEDKPRLREEYLTVLYDYEKKQLVIGLSSEMDTQSKFYVYDILGRVVSSNSFYVRNGNNDYSFSLPNLSIGTYICKVSGYETARFQVR